MLFVLLSSIAFVFPLTTLIRSYFVKPPKGRDSKLKPSSPDHYHATVTDFASDLGLSTFLLRAMAVK